MRKEGEITYPALGNITRREFLKDSGFLIAGVVATRPFGLRPSSAFAQEPEGSLPSALTFEQRVTREREHHPIYTQFLDAEGILIKAPQVASGAQVDARALQRAREIVLAMNNPRPDMRIKMVEREAALAIIPKNAFITILPEFSYLSGRRDPNGNSYDSFTVRGAGGIPGQPVTATSEENLLRLPENNTRFPSEDITYHEFAHAIMNLGFNIEQRNAWLTIYNSARARNTFPNAFAMVNQDEYWAELSQSWFKVNNDIGTGNEIRARDQEAFWFLESVYGNPR